MAGFFVFVFLNFILTCLYLLLDRLKCCWKKQGQEKITVLTTPCTKHVNLLSNRSAKIGAEKREMSCKFETKIIKKEVC